MPGFAIGCQVGLGLGTAPSTPTPEPTTEQFAYAAVAAGWTLLTDPATTEDKHYTLATGNQDFASIWSGTITGTEAKVAMQADFNYKEDDLLDISVDGGAWTASGAADGNDEYTLFTGLSDGPHRVSFRVRSSNIYAFMPSTGNVLRVTGAAPAVTPPTWTQVGDTNTDTICPNGLMATATDARMGAGRTPLERAAHSTGTNGRVGDQSMIALRTASAELWVVGQVRHVFVYDGETLTVHDTETAAALGQNGLRVSRITGLAGVETTYWVYGGNESGVPGPWFAVGVPDGESFATLSMPVAHMWGDSIVEGISGDDEEATDNLNAGYVDAIRAFANAGYAPGNFGISGSAWSDYQSGEGEDIAGHLSFLTVTANDAAYVALGQNDATVTQAHVEYVLGQLLAAGYGRVIVRGVLPLATDTGDTGVSAKNAVIQAAIAAVDDAKVRYIDTLGENAPGTNPRWSDVAVSTAGIRPDGIHFVPGGYALLLAHMDATLPGALA